MRHFVVEYDDGTIAVVYPVARLQLSLLDLLTQRLFRLWVELECRTDLLVESVSGWQLVEAIGKLIRSEKLSEGELVELKRLADDGSASQPKRGRKKR